MFNNRFNSTKKDPLVEAVQSAMQDGEIRRQAVAYVNEAFGVYNRNAVVREDLAEYDAAIEEAYNCMKEGEKKDEKKEDKPKADYSKMREKMVGKGKDLETTRKIVGEAKKLADKDYDKDGKIESPKDEVWGSRFRAAKMAGKMEEDEQIDEATGLKKVVHKVFGKQIAKHRANKADSEMERTLNTRGSEKKWAKNYDARERYGRIAAGKPPFKDMDEETQIDELKAPTAKTAHDAYRRAERSDDEKGNWDRSNRLYSNLKKKYPGKSDRNQKPTGKAKLPSVSNTEFHKDGYSGHVTKKGKLTKSATKDTKADIKSRLGRHTKPNLPEEVDYSAPDRAAVTRDNRPSTPAQTNAATSGPSAADKAALTSKIKTMKEALKGNQHRIDANKNNKIDSQDFKLLRARKSMKEENLEELSAFGAEFAKQRASGAKTFSWGGKTITTQLKGQTGSPSAKPSGVSSAKPSAGMSAGSASALGSSSSSSLPSMASSATPSRIPSSAENKAAASIVRDKGPSMTRQYSFPGSTVAPPSADVDTKTPKAPTSAADVSGGDKMKAMSNLKSDLPKTPGSMSISSQPAPSGGAASGEQKMKAMSSLKESVQVGTNKYRIV